MACAVFFRSLPFEVEVFLSRSKRKKRKEKKLKLINFLFLSQNRNTHPHTPEGEAKELIRPAPFYDIEMGVHSCMMGSIHMHGKEEVEEG